MSDTKTGYRPSHTMRALIRDNAQLLPAISRFGIPFGFGDSPVGEVCRRNGVDVNTFLCVCNLLSGYRYDPVDLSLDSLMGYLKRAHTSFLDITLPKIRHNLIEAINYTSTDEVSLLLIKFFDDYVVEVKRHMEHENDVIFRYVDRLIKGESDPEFTIERFSGNHEPMAARLNELKDIFIYHYNQKENARLSAVLFDIITCEKDLISHFEVENNLFIPAVEKLEKKVKEPTERVEEESEKEKAESVLSEREKDIIRAVAKGRTNKEMADELCISVHTVATHRRNISAKLGIHSPAGLVIYALINHLVELAEVNPQ
ncbi:MAG: helix-turn-helix transcriptional regulator [Bacteroides sp.]|nr:helix-turn-helix transcriptional regulator [Bacteroides sp.]